MKKHEASTKYDPGYDFHFPYALRRDWEYEDGLKECVEAVKDGMTSIDAIMMVFEITSKAAYNWFTYAEEDLEKGYTKEDSRLINLILTLASYELNVRRRLERKANSLALDDDNPSTEMLKFLLERRHGYIKQTQKDVDVAVNEEAPIKFEFTDMTPTENEE